MATGSFSAYYSMGNVHKSDFLGWSQNGLSAALTSCGFALTSDTGQISFSGLSDPLAGGNPQLVGYQIYKFNDTQQSSLPFFFRLEYLINTYASQLYTRWTFGTSTDGGGNMTGTVSPQLTVLSNQTTLSGTPSGTLQQSVFAGGSSTSGGSWFSAVMWDGSSFQDPWFFSIERTVDTNGNANSDGIIVHMGASNQGFYSFVLPSTSSGNVALAPNNYFCVPLNYKQLSMAGSGVVGVSFPIPFNGRPYNYGYGCCLFQGSDFGPQSTNTFSVYGSNHTYRVPTVVTPGQLTPVSTAQARIMLRYE